MKKIILTVAILATAFFTAAAQDETPQISDLMNPLITGVPSLSIGPDAVAGGMADVGVATDPDINSQHFNSSKYAQCESSAGFALTYVPWLRRLGVNDIHLAYLAGYYTPSVAAGTVSASLRFFSLGEVQLRETSDAIPVSAHPYELAFDLGYSRMLSEHFSMGVVARLVASDLSAKTDANYYTGYAFAADINGYLNLPIDIATGESRFMFGFNLSNIGTKISYDKGDNFNFLPLNIKLGLGYKIPFNDYNRLLISLEANKMMVPSRYSKFTEGFDPENQDTWAMKAEQYNDISVFRGLAMSWCDAPGGAKEELKEINWAVGLEYSYNEQFFGRIGYNNEAKTKGNRKFFTLGAGFKLSAFKLDVGYVVSVAQNNPLDQTLRFTLSFDVDGLKELADR